MLPSLPSDLITESLPMVDRDLRTKLVLVNSKSPGSVHKRLNSRNNKVCQETVQSTSAN